MVDIVYCGKQKIFHTISSYIFHYLFLIPQLAFDGLRRSEGRQSVTSWDTFPTLLIYEWNIIKIHMNGNLRLKFCNKMKMYNSDLLLQWQLLAVVVWLCAEAALDAVKSPSSDEERKAGNILAAAALAAHLQPG